ncbi:MAG: hypothetical protein ACKPKO_52770, partial [Candidatus Fonsibacter sp.]
MAADQHRGLHGDRNRFYVAATRGRLSLAVWLEQMPFSLPLYCLQKLLTDHRGVWTNKLLSITLNNIANCLGPQQ